MTNAIGLLCFRPNAIWCEFLDKFENYKIFIIVDDSKYDCTYLEKLYKNIIFIKIKNSKCMISGYTDMNFTIDKKVSAWEKAMYYFYVENTEYDYIWLIEDDVYFFDELTIKTIDNQFENEDLLSNTHQINWTGEKNYWNWPYIEMKLEPPYYNGMMCAIRISKNLLKCINEYATNYRTLFFLEALFPTLAIKHELKIGFPKELKNIHYRYTFKEEEIDKNQLYHPVKNFIHHLFYRSL